MGRNGDSLTRRIALVALVALLGGSGALAAPVTRTVGPFDIVFYNSGDSNGSYTSSQNWTTEQMDDVAAGVQVWDNGFANTAGRQISMDLIWYGFSGGILGGSANVTNGNGVNAWSYAEHIWRDGVNYDGPWDGWDTMIIYDVDAAGTAWNFGSDLPTAGQIDFRSVIVHELGHTLGFLDTYYPAPFDDWGNAFGDASSPDNYAGFRGLTAWDSYLRDDAGNRPASGSTGTPGNFNELDNPVWFVGPNATSLYGGNVPVYAPTSYQGGSSLSHINPGTVPDLLMSPFISLGNVHRAPTPLEWQVMKDLGWTLQEAAVPEPSTLALAGIGLAALLIAKRRPR